jgi:DNA topoisomerase IA
MAKKLVIFESPGKVKKIQLYLDNSFGPDYLVMASVGHVRDLPARGYGVEAPEYILQYEVSKDKVRVVGRLLAAAKQSSLICLAMDPDREGEAIAWHLKEVLGSNRKYVRIIFNEITASAIQAAQSLYALIRFGAIASQLSNGIDSTTVVFFEGCGNSGRNFEYRTKGRVVVRHGWRALESDVAGVEDMLQSEDDQNLPNLLQGNKVIVVSKKVSHKKTRPVALYTEATLIKKLESAGVGRPSTYASIVEKIRSYGYITVINRQYSITGIGGRLVLAVGWCWVWSLISSL